MGRRAPNNQPTSSIKRMMDYAEKELRYWERVEKTAAETLKTANSQQVHWSKTLASLRSQHDTRLEEERNMGPRGEQGPHYPGEDRPLRHVEGDNDGH